MLCNSPGFVNLAGKGLGGQATQGCVGWIGVVELEFPRLVFETTRSGCRATLREAGRHTYQAVVTLAALRLWL